MQGVSRREVLAGIGAGAVGVAGLGAGDAGTASGRARVRSRADGDEPGRYVVGTESGRATAAAQSRADAVDRTLDFDDIGRVVAGEFTDEAVRALARRDDVRYVETQTVFRAAGAEQARETRQTVPWGIDRIDADVAHAEGKRGSGVDVAIIDSGIQPNHPDLRDNLGEGRAFVDCWADLRPRCRAKPGSPNVECFLQVDLCATDWGDDFTGGHGTHVAGTAAALDNDRGVVGVAPAATLHAVKVLNAGSVGRDADIAAGIKHVADEGWDVANLSVQSSGSSRALADACRYAREEGVLLVAAAGNSGPAPDTVAYPAAFEEVLAVGATTRADRIAPFSSRGSAVELAAPGADVCSTFRPGTTVESGTSMAAPHVSGVGALLMAEGLSNVEARERLRETAENVGGESDQRGAGLVDAAAALGLDSADDGTGTGVCKPAGGVPSPGDESQDEGE